MGNQITSLAFGNEATVVRETLFFPDKAMPCRYHIWGRGCRRGDDCTFSHIETSLTTLLSYFQRAKESLDICVFTITCKEVGCTIYFDI